MPWTYGWGQATVRHCTRGYPGALSWKPLSHMAQLSVASDHSPTRRGSVVCCMLLRRARHEHAFSKNESCHRTPHPANQRSGAIRGGQR